ncbi:hypothetical protein [Dickeya lacustris]|uniref:Uncharacterized protein n=1 Tax=Dickeya lacustris TaxID=2259638 RepID=A0ABY8G6G2_9GAMM|nr:hypothetical protein [Dickeya lacustris]WFN55548.1 hypothetical protein O1Q98_18480 [Dickeya lacustris]
MEIRADSPQKADQNALSQTGSQQTPSSTAPQTTFSSTGLMMSRLFGDAHQSDKPMSASFSVYQAQGNHNFVVNTASDSPSRLKIPISARLTALFLLRQAEQKKGLQWLNDTRVHDVGSTLLDVLISRGSRTLKNR